MENWLESSSPSSHMGRSAIISALRCSPTLVSVRSRSLDSDPLELISFDCAGGPSRVAKGMFHSQGPEIPDLVHSHAHKSCTEYRVDKVYTICASAKEI